MIKYLSPLFCGGRFYLYGLTLKFLRNNSTYLPMLPRNLGRKHNHKEFFAIHTLQKSRIMNKIFSFVIKSTIKHEDLFGVLAFIAIFVREIR